MTEINFSDVLYERLMANYLELTYAERRDLFAMVNKSEVEDVNKNYTDEEVDTSMANIMWSVFNIPNGLNLHLNAQERHHVIVVMSGYFKERLSNQLNNLLT